MSAIKHFIELADGRKLDIWYSINSAKRLRKKYGTFAGAMVEELAETLPDLIYEGLVDRSNITPEEIGEQISFSKANEYQEVVLSAMAGITIDEYRKRIDDAKAKEVTRLEKLIAAKGLVVMREEGMTTDEYLTLLYQKAAEKNEPAQPPTIQ
jgi:hypothetical protein